MLHVYNPEIVFAMARAARPDRSEGAHRHHDYDLRVIRAAERRAARQAFMKAARAFLQAGATRVKKAFRLDERAGQRASVVLPKPRGGTVKCEACA